MRATVDVPLRQRFYTVEELNELYESRPANRFGLAKSAHSV